MEGDVENRGYLDFIREIKGVVGFGTRGDIIEIKPLAMVWGYSGLATGRLSRGLAW